MGEKRCYFVIRCNYKTLLFSQYLRFQTILWKLKHKLTNLTSKRINDDIVFLLISTCAFKF